MAHPDPAQNIYDDPDFFAGYSRLERSTQGLDGAPEWPNLRALLPPIEGMRVVDLGCGFGWFARWAAEHGATSVCGVDVSQRMLARATADTADARIEYQQQDLDALVLPDATFELAFSSLALHYVADINQMLERVATALSTRGVFVFSVEHPIFTAPTRPGFVADDQGHTVWPLDAYLAEGERITDWLTNGVLKQHRTIATYVNALITAGFVVDRIEEWGPSPDQIRARPEWRPERDRPPFLLVRASIG